MINIIVSINCFMPLNENDTTKKACVAVSLHATLLKACFKHVCFCIRTIRTVLTTILILHNLRHFQTSQSLDKRFNPKSSEIDQQDPQLKLVTIMSAQTSKIRYVLDNVYLQYCPPGNYPAKRLHAWRTENKNSTFAQTAQTKNYP